MASKTPSTWQQPAETLDRQSLRALIAGDIPAILIERFATGDECLARCRAIRGHGSQAISAQTSAFIGRLPDDRLILWS